MQNISLCYCLCNLCYYAIIYTDYIEISHITTYDHLFKKSDLVHLYYDLDL